MSTTSRVNVCRLDFLFTPGASVCVCIGGAPTLKRALEHSHQHRVPASVPQVDEGHVSSNKNLSMWLRLVRGVFLLESENTMRRSLQWTHRTALRGDAQDRSAWGHTGPLCVGTHRTALRGEGMQTCCPLIVKAERPLMCSDGLRGTIEQ